MLIDFNQVQSFDTKLLPVVDVLPDGNKKATLICDFDQDSEIYQDFIKEVKDNTYQYPCYVWVPAHQFMAQVQFDNVMHTVKQSGSYTCWSKVNNSGLIALVSDLAELRDIDIDNTVSTIRHYLQVSNSFDYLNKMFKFLDDNVTKVNTDIDLYQYFSICTILACINNNVHSSEYKLYIALNVLPKALALNDQDLDVLKVVLNRIGFDVEAPDIVKKSGLATKLWSLDVQTVLDVLNAYNYVSLLG